jgi:hypothetical protein
VTSGIAAGVPFVAAPPDGGPRRDAPAVVAWHLLDSPRTPEALAAGTDPAPQTPHAAAVDRLAVDWFSAHLPR